MNTELKQDAAFPHVDGETAEDSQETAANALKNESTEQFQQIWAKVSVLLADLPEYVSDFFKEYKRPIVTIGLILAAIISVKLTLAILGAINEIPLLAPVFELIGLTYSGWFVYRYLLRASNRQELLEDFNSLKAQVLGKRA